MLLDMTTEAWARYSLAEQSSGAKACQQSWAAHLGVPPEREELHSGCLVQMVLIPPGRFWCGAVLDELDAGSSESPRHIVEFPEPFWLGKYAITQGQWVKLTGQRPWSSERYAKDAEDCAATCISFEDVTDLVLPKLGPEFSLPTEARWEYACRAGTTSRFYWGDDLVYADVDQYAWFDRNCWETGETFAHEVGRKRPNAWGLHDMSGNVIEWCSDWSAPYRGTLEVDPQGPEVGSRRVVRGGYWSFWARRCRSAYRCSCAPDLRDCLLGARLMKRHDR